MPPCGGAGRQSLPRLLAQQEHRPWPLPDRPWFMFQSWQDLLFAHWPVPAAQIAKQLPSGLALDMYAGEAWGTVVPFRMSGVRQRFTPAAPWVSSFPELNVRTYVKSSGREEPKPGVFFFSLDAGNPLAVAMARRSYHLPYFRAQMECKMEDGGIRYSSRRTHKGAPEADFRAVYRPTGPVYRAAPDSLEQWLMERYCLYSVDRAGASIGVRSTIGPGRYSRPRQNSSAIGLRRHTGCSCRIQSRCSISWRGWMYWHGG